MANRLPARRVFGSGGNAGEELLGETRRVNGWACQRRPCHGARRRRRRGTSAATTIASTATIAAATTAHAHAAVPVLAAVGVDGTLVDVVVGGGAVDVVVGCGTVVAGCRAVVVVAGAVVVVAGAVVVVVATLVVVVGWAPGVPTLLRRSRNGTVRQGPAA